MHTNVFSLNRQFYQSSMSSPLIIVGRELDLMQISLVFVFFFRFFFFLHKSRNKIGKIASCALLLKINKLLFLCNGNFTNK